MPYLLAPMLPPSQKNVNALQQHERDMRVARFVVRTFFAACIAIFCVALWGAAFANAATIASCTGTVGGWGNTTGYSQQRGLSGYTGTARSVAIKAKSASDCTVTTDTGSGQFRLRNSANTQAVECYLVEDQFFTSGVESIMYANCADWDVSNLNWITTDGATVACDEGTVNFTWGIMTSNVCSGYAGTSDTGTDKWFEVYDTSFSLDGRGDATVTVIEPDEGEGISEATINALGADAYYFSVTTDVDRTEYPSETPYYEVEIYDQATQTTLVCAMDATTGNSLDSINYGTQLNHKVNGNPDPCDNFAQDDYSVRARVTFDGFDPSEWSEWVDFTVGETDFDPPLTCEEGASFLSLCWWQNLLTFLFQPSQAALDGLFDVIGSFGDHWPFSWLSDGADAFLAAYDVTPDDLGSVDAGNPFALEMPSAAWIALQVRMWYGDWAEGAAALVIWLGAFASIARSGLALLNVQYDDVIDTA